MLDTNLKLLYLLCVLLNLFIGAAVFVRNKKSPVNRMFFLFTIIQAAWIGSLYLGYHYIVPYSQAKSTFFIRLAYGFGFLMYPILCTFFYYFPQKTFTISRFLKLLFISSALLLVSLAFFTPLVHQSQILMDGVYVGDAYGPLYLTFLLYLVSSLLISGVIAVKKALASSGIEKKQVLIAMVGCLSFLLLTMTNNVVLPFLGIHIFPYKAVLFSFFFTVPTFYAIQKHRFFNFSYAYLNILGKVALLGVFVSVITIIYYPSKQLVGSFWANIVGPILVLYLFSKANALLPLLTTESFRKFQNAIMELNSKMYYSESYVELQNILEKRLVVNSRIISAKIFIIRNSQTGIKIPVYVKDEFTEYLESYKNDLLVLDEIEFKGLPKDTKSLVSSVMAKLEASLCVPLFSEKKLIGFFVLGPKSDKDTYSKEEIQEILKLKSNLGICLMNVLLRGDIQEENNLMKEIIEKKTKKLKKHFEEIKELLRQQSDFLAITAHEFRTPLSIALFQLDDTLRSHKHPAKVFSEMKTTEESLKNLKNLTQKLFDVQQYDLNKVTLNKNHIHLPTFLEEIRENFQSIIEEKSIELFFENKLKDNEFLDLDESQMRQVFYNLLDNSIKFANKITLRVEEDPKNIVIKIIDNGKEIPDVDKKRIFEKFQSRKSSMGLGIGLGLYICKKIITLHGGKIWTEDSKGGGATFCVKLGLTDKTRKHDSLERRSKTRLPLSSELRK